jgi:hypothetical protein
MFVVCIYKSGTVKDLEVLTLIPGEIIKPDDRSDRDAVDPQVGDPDGAGAVQNRALVSLSRPAREWSVPRRPA